jgi:hypothetical protein
MRKNARLLIKDDGWTYLNQKLNQSSPETST